MITESSAEFEFHGGRARSAPLAWGQQGTWDVIRHWYPETKPFFVLTRWLPVPLLLELGDVLEELAELMRRHEALRTLYHASERGEVTQEVLPGGVVTVDLYDRPADDPVSFTDIVTTCVERGTATGFDHEREVPIRFAVALHEGIPVLVVFAVSHLSADYLSADLLAAELNALLRARVDRVPAPPARPAAQPVDLATFERSPQGQLLNVEAMRHLRQHLDRITPGLLPARATPVTPRFHRGELESDAMPVALRAAARRHRTTTSVLLLAVSMALLGRFCPGPVLPLDIMQSNRSTPELFHTVSSLNQAVRTAVDLPAVTFADLVERAARVMAQARAYARYDGRAAQQVIATAARSRGTDFEPGCQFNDMWSTLPRPAGRPVTDPAELDRLAAATTFGWPQTADAEGMVVFLDVRGTAERLQLSLMADTALLPPDDIRAVLFAFERVAIALATGEVTLAGMHAILDGCRTDPAGPGDPARAVSGSPTTR
ncbi:condensation domain-containing protein [Micromonospora cathayae]|uniref:Condensation domain-containing protein n=1 Tax=Micromonospora cathayae TaxID=3028804 RepID=A0ABY7ZKY5_9ACTN|nr:condensation domain-containing protein [Micromonospora sp. HUAS 3]WDZ82634.1 condensation domain-containing protein [Micromonospora sp. HUAS 3]